MMRDTLDMVVLGGGITGAGIARDAALRGLRVALFEKGDFASGTSSKSSKLIHGGLRYLEQGEVGLVFESVSERRVQRRMAPHLVRPLRFLMPIFDGDRVGLETMNLGLWIYDTLAMFRAPGLHKTHRGKKARKLEPRIRSEGLRGAIEYSDCVTDDARLVLENVIAAREAGAACHNHIEVIGIERHRERVAAVTVRDLHTGIERRVATHCLVIAAGPWTDRVGARLGLGISTPILRPTKGVHLVFPREVLPLERAVTVISPVDGRVMFAIPWQHRLVLGTTDTDFDGDPDDVFADAGDVAYLCESGNKTFPNAELSPDKVISTWAGLRPLIHEAADTASDVSREHQIYVRDEGVVLIAGGKLTTYRLMAKQTVKAAIRWLNDNDSDLFEDRPLVRPRTKTRPLPGGTGLEGRGPDSFAKLAAKLADQYAIDVVTTGHLADVYGARAHAVCGLIQERRELGEAMQPDLPFVWAEIHYAVVHEMAATVEDVLARRVPLLLLGREQGLDVAERTSDIVARLLSWTDDRRRAELERYRGVVANTRRFRNAG